MFNTIQTEDSIINVEEITGKKPTITAVAVIKKEKQKEQVIKFKRPSYDKMGLISTIGIEFSFIKSVFDSSSYENYLDEFEDSIAYKHVKVDDTAIEVQSPVCESFEELISFYNFINSKTNRLGLHGIIIVIENGVSGQLPSGGGHINLGYPYHETDQLRQNYVRELFYQLNMRPYLAWIFNEPMDNTSCSSFDGILTHGYENFDTDDYNRNDIDDYDRTSHANFYNCYNIQTKDAKIAFDSITHEDRKAVEFRMFNAYQDEYDVFRCVDFINEFCKICNDPKQQSAPETLDDNNLKEIYNTLKSYQENIDLCINEFKNLCVRLKLNYSDYKDKIEDNLRERFRLGKKYLV